MNTSSGACGEELESKSRKGNKETVLDAACIQGEALSFAPSSGIGLIGRDAKNESRLEKFPDEEERG